jgi:hypothetical protein
MKAKIAICFLITKDVSNPELWERWWKGYEDKINIYSHYSVGKEENVTLTWLKKGRVTPIPTKWGDISLVKAEGQLYKKAIKDKDNKFFILVSDTCIPVRTFMYTYRRLMRNPNKGIMPWFSEDKYKITDEDFKPFIKSIKCTPTLVNEKIVDAPLYSANQWKALSRSNTKDFLNMLKDKIYMRLYTKCIEVIPDSLAPDEFMYANFLKNKHGSINKVMRIGIVTNVRFRGSAIHPIPYKNITPVMREEICDNMAMFARKFPQKNLKLLKQLPISCGKTV